MNILLNNQITLQAMGYTGFLIIGVDGLGISDIRTSSFVFSGRDGGLNTDQFADMRNINITAKLVSPDAVQHAIDRQALINALPLGTTTFPVDFTMFNGTTYRAYCNLIKLTMPINNGGRRSDVLIQLSAGDPLFYRTDAGDQQTANVPKVTQGGYVTPYILPVVWEVGGAPTVVLNSGTAVSYPVITLTNIALNPVITNQLTGERFKLTLSMLAGDVVVIDMKARTVTLNGSDILGNKTSDSIWWGLLPGNNPILLDTDTGGDTVTAVITWRNGVTGI